MNNIYKLIFNISTGTWAVAHELASSRGKKTGRSRLAVAMAVAMAASATLPAGSVFANDIVAVPAACSEPRDQSDVSGMKASCEESSALSLNGGMSASEGPTVLGGGFGSGLGISIGYAGSMTSYAVGNGDISIGGMSRADGGGGNWATAVGDEARAIGALAAAFGVRAKATAAQATAVGAEATASGQWALAVGTEAKATFRNSVAVGSQASAGALHANAFGANAKAEAEYSLAVGADTRVAAKHAVALGATSVADRENTVSIGSASLKRQLVNMAAGTADTDATNVAQLRGIADGLGGGAAVAADGSITAPSYSVDGTTVDNVGDALTNIDGRTTDNTTNISNLDSRVTVNEGNITQLQQDIDTGSVGLVKQDAASGAITVADASGGTSVNFAGTAGDRTLGGVAAGTLSATSNEAVTGSQLFATNERVTQNESDITTIEGDITTMKGDITNIDSRLTVNEGEINQISQQITEISEGTVGMVTFDAATGSVQVGKDQGGTFMNMSGTDGARRLSGVGNGINDDDAVTLAQLKASGLVDPNDGRALGALVYDDMSLGRATLGGTNGTIIGNLGNGLIAAGSREAVNGGQLYDMSADWENRWNQMEDRVSHIEENGVPGTGTGPGTSPGTGDGSVAIGDGSNAEGSGSVAIGEGSSATGEGSVAIGEGSSASGDNSVAIGKGSKADGDNEFSVGAPGNERRITNVSAGIDATDAVNVGQMNDRFQAERDWANDRFQAVDKRMDRMAAMSAAYSGMAMNTAGLEGDNRIGAGIGAQNGRTALAVGYQRILGKKKNVSVSLGGAFSGSDKSVSAGTGLSW